MSDKHKYKSCSEIGCNGTKEECGVYGWECPYIETIRKIDDKLMSDSHEKRKLIELYNEYKKNGFPVVVPAEGPLEDGYKFTIPGIKFLPDGTMIQDCAPGEETEMVVQIVPAI